VTIATWLADAPDRTEAEWVLVHVLGLRRFELPLDDHVPAGALPLAARLAAGEPLQYVLGDTNFFGLHLQCDPRALIPRPETEELVALVLDHITPETPTEAAAFHVVDVGTGTGCIALAVKAERPNCRVTGVDISPDALELARANAETCNLDVTFVEGNLLEALAADERIDLLVSNLPYIGTGEIPGLDANVRDHEPHLALDGGDDGLDLIRRLIPQARRRLAAGAPIFLEMGESQGPAVAGILVEAGFEAVEIGKDFAGHDRFALAKMPL